MACYRCHDGGATLLHRPGSHVDWVLCQTCFDEICRIQRMGYMGAIAAQRAIWTLTIVGKEAP